MDFIPINKTTSKKEVIDKVDFEPTFTEDQEVTLKEEFKHYSTEHEKMFGKTFKVAYCKISDLGDMLVEVLYLKENNIFTICNPYLVKFFKAS